MFDIGMNSLDEGTKNRATIFVTDEGFLVPTLVVARQLAHHRASEFTDILIYLIGIAKDLFSQLEKTCALDGIKFIELDPATFELPSGSHFRDGHVPLATLGRLVLAKFIPEQYEHIVYLDGDMQIVGDITPLITYDVPEGKIASVNGSRWLNVNADGSIDQWSQAYLNDLGGVMPEEYFNAGLLAFRRSTWAEIGPAALKFFFDNSKACHHHDQSALNAVCKGRREELPPAYNFHSEYAGLFVQSIYKPVIVHFTGSAKPWAYAIAPWGRKYNQPYHQLLREFPFLKPYLINLEKVSVLKETARFFKKIKQLWPQREKIKAARRIFFKHLKEDKFAI